MGPIFVGKADRFTTLSNAMVKVWWGHWFNFVCLVRKFSVSIGVLPVIYLGIHAYAYASGMFHTQLCHEYSLDISTIIHQNHMAPQDLKAVITTQKIASLARGMMTHILVVSNFSKSKPKTEYFCLIFQLGNEDQNFASARNLFAISDIFLKFLWCTLYQKKQGWGPLIF